MIKFTFLGFFLFLWRSSPTRASASSLLRFIGHTHTHTHTHTHGATPLNEWSALRRGHYLHNAQQTHKTNIHAVSGILTRDPSSQAAEDPRLSPHGHHYRHSNILVMRIFYIRVWDALNCGTTIATHTVRAVPRRGSAALRLPRLRVRIPLG